MGVSNPALLREVPVTEFMFRNLSVKVFAEAADDGPVCDCCSYVIECGSCSECTDGPTAPPECGPCTDTPTVDCDACTDFETIPECGVCTDTPTNECFPCSDFEGTGAPECLGDTCQDDTHCINTLLILLPPPDDPGRGVRAVRAAADVRREMELLKRELRAAMTLEPDVEPIGSSGRPETLEEVDRLRHVLLEAVAELDERDRAIRGGPSD